LHDLFFEVVLMAYLGTHLYSCHAIPFDWNDTWVVVVSGDGPNYCGHSLLKVGYNYFHIDKWNRPYHLTESGYKRYVQEGGKSEIFRRKVHIPDPESAQRGIEALSVKIWYWLLVPNNCVSFVEAVLSAGGVNEVSVTNCPRLWK
jgi:hypothetical protein